MINVHVGYSHFLDADSGLVCASDVTSLFRYCLTVDMSTSSWSGDSSRVQNVKPAS